MCCQLKYLNKRKVDLQLHWQTSPACREACPSCHTHTLQHYSWRHSAPSPACPAWSSYPEESPDRNWSALQHRSNPENDNSLVGFNLKGTRWQKVTSFSTKRLSMSTASCHCGLFSIGSSSIFVLTLGFLACGGWSDFFSPLASSVVV